MRRLFLGALLMSAVFLTGMVQEARAVDQPATASSTTPKKHKKSLYRPFKKTAKPALGTPGAH